VTVFTLHNALVRPILEYAVKVWSPTLIRDIKRLEEVQARATKLIPALQNKGYQRKLKDLNLFHPSSSSSFFMSSPKTMGFDVLMNLLHSPYPEQFAFEKSVYR
jgi:hypothetical protein